MLAIHISPQQYQRMVSRQNGQWALTFPTVTFPTQTSATPATEGNPQSTTSAGAMSTTTSNANNTNQLSNNVRMFAILRTQPGENPFDLGDPMQNLKQVMGHTLWDWLLPLKVAPCVDHSSTVSAYPMGPVVDRLKREAGITFEDDEVDVHSANHQPTVTH